ncbi:MAG: hypothetical protein ACRDWI_17515 [Jiangellaceae bacterium]
MLHGAAVGDQHGRASGRDHLGAGHAQPAGVDVERVGAVAACVNAVANPHGRDLATDVDGGDVSAGAGERAADLDAVDGPTGKHADRVGGQPGDHTLDQRVAGAAMGVDTVADDEASKLFAHLHADGGVGMDCDAVELGGVDHASGVDVEAAGSDPVRLDGRADAQRRRRPEVDEADTAAAVRRDRRLGHPAVDGAPVVQGHVVDAVGGDRSTVSYVVDVAAGDDEHAAADQVGRSLRDPAVSEDGPRLQQARREPATAGIGTAGEYAAAPYRRAVAPGRDAAQLRRDHHVAVGVEVPERERALQDTDAHQMRPVVAVADVGVGHVQAVDDDMPGADGVAHQNLYLADGRDGGQPERAEVGDGRVVEDRPAVLRDAQADLGHLIVGAELYPVDAVGERHRGVVVGTRPTASPGRVSASAYRR